MKLRLAFAIAALSTVCAESQAVVLVQYTFTGSVDTATTKATNVGATDFTAAPGIIGGADSFSYYNGFSTATPVAGSVASASAPIRYVRGSAASASTTEAVTNGDYFSFIVTPAAGFQINLTSLTFDYATNGATGAANTAGFGFAFGAPGFSSVTLLSPVTISAPDANAVAFLNSTVAVSNTLTGATEFRFYASNSNVGGVARFDNITLNGTVSPIPEPAAAALALIGGVFAFGRRRRA